ncbi:MAG: hypothetical protein JWM28_2530 [Chitinophagaceae bacterium]|nr:hypothetical protein [Chitinophagaceae bacterium]
MGFFINSFGGLISSPIAIGVLERPAALREGRRFDPDTLHRFKAPKGAFVIGSGTPNKMQYTPNIHHRRSIRLKGYDYSQTGSYFITICVKDRKCLFGEIVDGVMILNDAGKMADNEWCKIPGRFRNVQLNEYIIMPNHFHGIVEIVGATLVVAPDKETVALDKETVAPHNETVAPDNETIIGDETEKGQPQGIAPTAKPKTVGDIVGAFQSITTVEYIRGVKQLEWHPFDGKLWQRNYYEHIIRDEQSYHRISEYIINNPKNWKADKFHND